MAFCIYCGQELAKGARFCSNCGAAVDGEDSSSQRKTVYEGSLHKCPNCGEILNSFVSNCPVCGYEIRDTGEVSSVEQLAAKLERLEAQRPPTQKTSVLAKAFGLGTLQGIDEQKIDLIKNFPIPNTKEDILDFIVLAAANIDLDSYGPGGFFEASKIPDPTSRKISDAWLAKLEQADQKAEIMFGQTQEYISVRNVYENKKKKIKWRKRRPMIVLFATLGAFLLIDLLLILSLSGK